MRLLVAGILLAIALLVLSSLIRTCSIPHIPEIYGSDCISPSVYRYGYPIAFWMVVIGAFMARAARRREEREDDEYYP